MGVELKLIEGLPHHKVHETGYDLVFLLAKSEEAPWLEPQETADYVFGILRNEKPEEENPLVNTKYAFSLTERDCSRLANKLKERPGFGHIPVPCETKASGVTLNIQRIAADYYWLMVKHPKKVITPYGVSSKDLSQICELLSGKLKEKI